MHRSVLAVLLVCACAADATSTPAARCGGGINDAADASGHAAEEAVILRVTPWIAGGVSVTFGYGWDIATLDAEANQDDDASFSVLSPQSPPLPLPPRVEVVFDTRSSSSSSSSDSTATSVAPNANVVVAHAPQASGGETAIVLALDATRDGALAQFDAAVSLVETLPRDERISVWMLNLPRAVLIADVTANKNRIARRLAQAKALVAAAHDNTTAVDADAEANAAYSASAAMDDDDSQDATLFNRLVAAGTAAAQYRVWSASLGRVLDELSPVDDTAEVQYVSRAHTDVCFF